MHMNICVPAEGCDHKSKFVPVCILVNIINGSASDIFVCAFRAICMHVHACVCVREREKRSKDLQCILSLSTTTQMGCVLPT